MLRTLFAVMSLVIVLALIGISATGAPTEFTSSELAMTATPAHDSNGAWRLQFELRHNGETPLVVSERSLPWKSPRDLLLVARQLNAASTPVAERETPVRDLPETYVTLNPGDALSGSVNLSGRLPGLGTASRETDVIVFWSHQIRPADDPAMPRLSGGIVIPRQR